MKEEIIFGRKVVLEALKNNQNFKNILLQISEKKSSQILNIISLAREKKIKYTFLPKAALNKMSSQKNHQGVIAIAENFKYETLEIFFAKIKDENSCFILAVNNLQDPHNLGAIIRSASAFGSKALIIPERNNATINETVHKTSAGYSLLLPIIKIKNLVETLNILKENNFWIYGLKKGGEDINNFKWENKICLVVGGEDLGLGNLVEKKCDFLVNIPIKENVNSLNVSVAAALAMYEVSKGLQNCSG